MITYSLSNKKEMMVCLAACGVIAFSPFLSLFVGLVRTVIIFPYKLDTIFVYGIFFLVLILAIKTVLNRSSVFIFGTIIVLFIAYLIAFGMNGYNIDYYMEYGISFLILSAPWIFMTHAVRDYVLFKRYLYISALIIIVSLIMNLYVFKTDIFGEAAYTQSYAYAILPAAVILCSNLFEKLKPLNTVLFMITIIFMFSMGARGPVICVILFLLLKLMVIYKRKLNKAIILSAVMVALTALINHYFSNILYLFLVLFEKLNLSTRILITLIEGTFLKDSARNALMEYSKELILKHPLLGVGIGNDRLLLANKMQNSGTLEAMGWYPHNIFLEFLLQFGVILGGAIIIFMLIVLYKSIFWNYDKDPVDIICIFIGIGLFPLLFSGSYITSPLFFALLGFSFFQYKKLKVEKFVKANI